jgi:iron complex outermembrane recepter protein
MNSAKVAKRILECSTAMGIVWSGSAVAQEAQDSAQPEASSGAIIVTARRVEERLQDVPISLTVLTQEDLTNNNISNASDLATYTPSMVASTRFGSDQTTYTIRGFTQEQRTSPTVGVYFADVVAPRGTGVLTGGDGAGPGMLFDLENVQVLKGPQGTLFGRNTSGGAVLLVPVKPRRTFEGYIEGTVGNFDRRRIQAVVNVPVSDTFRVRVGVDHDERNGHLKNLGFPTQFGRDMGSVDYWTVRAGAVWEVTPTLENYTIGYYTSSKGSGTTPAIERCFDGSGPNRVEVTPAGRFATGNGISNVRFSGFFPTGQSACNQIARESQEGFYVVSNANPEAGSLMEQWQVINRTTWTINDNLTLTNIIAYGEHRSNNSISAFGDFMPLRGTTLAFSSPLTAQNVVEFVGIQDDPRWGWTSAQSTFVEELRLTGTSFDDRLNWQAGLYYELNRPIGRAGQQQGLFTPCLDDDTLNCVPLNLPVAPGYDPTLPVSLGRLSYSSYRNRFEGYAAYAQGTFAITDQLSLTAGIRYTVDESQANARIGTIFVAANPANATFSCTNPTAPRFGQTLPADARYTDACEQNFSQKTEAPTWTLGLEYKPIDDVLLYGKWTRGYRQGAVAPASPDGLQKYDKETIDAYEVGAKTSWRGSMPGSFNIAAFYNDFRGQILQLGVSCDAAFPNYKGPCSPTTALINAGKSRLYGIETELTVSPFRGLNLRAAYAYLNTKLQEIEDVSLPPDVIYNLIRPLPVGGELPFSVPHNFTATATYVLPLDESVGEISISGTVVYQSSWFNSADGDPTDNFFVGRVPSYTFGNATLTWNRIGG